MRGKCLRVDEAVGVLELLGDEIVDHLAVLNLLLLGLADQLLLRCIINVPVGGLDVFGFQLELRPHDLLGLEGKV